MTGGSTHRPVIGEPLDYTPKKKQKESKSTKHGPGRWPSNQCAHQSFDTSLCIHTYVCQRTVTPQPRPASRATKEAAVVQQLHASIVDRGVRRRRPAKECLPVSPLYICVVHPPLVCKTCQIRWSYAVRISRALVYSCISHSCTYPRNRGMSSRT